MHYINEAIISIKLLHLPMEFWNSNFATNFIAAEVLFAMDGVSMTTSVMADT